MVQRRRIGSAILSMAFCCGFFCSGFLVRSASAASEDEYYELMKIFVDTFEQIDRNYVTQVDRRELIEAAMRGMIIKLDPYSSYIDTKDLKSFNEHVEQEFGGIGIQVDLDQRTRQLYVVMPMPGTPAFKAGIRRGDRILEIDGKVTADFPQGQEMPSAIALIKGKPDTTVKIKVQHVSAEKKGSTLTFTKQDPAKKTPDDKKSPDAADANAPANVGSDSQETYEITRAVIKTPTVLGHHYDEKGEWVDMIDEGEKIAYIRLTSFGRNSAEEMHDALVKLQKEGMRGLVLDLRFNPGGLLTAATAIADDFITKGVIVSTKGRNTEEQVIMAKKSGTFSGFPMVVLVNRASASASEIVSACLQDYKRAIIVGERTWGKGSVQNVIDLDGGKSAIKLTTASYHRPSGKNIHRFPKATEKDEWGVMPDEGYNLRLTDDELGGLYDSMAERERLPRDGAAPHAKFVDKQLDAGMAAIRKLLAEGKPIVEQPIEKVATPETKPEEKKADGTSSVESRFRQSFVDAILEFLSLYPKSRTSAVL